MAWKRPLATLAAIAASLSAVGEEAVPKYLQLGRMLVSEVAPGDNRYVNGSLIRWKGDLFTSSTVTYTDCSGFVSGVLEKAGHPALEQLKTGTYWRGKYPQAASFHEAITRQVGFTRVGNVADLAPGDVVAILYPPGSGSPHTGHVMLVDGKPLPREAAAPLVDGTRQWEFAVVDSAPGPHGQEDTRYTGNAADKRSGVGRGLFRIYATPEGTPVGYAWSELPTARYYPMSARPIALGRPMQPGEGKRQATPEIPE